MKAHRFVSCELSKSGAPGRIRTCDLPVRSRALYPLSYKRMHFRVLDYFNHWRVKCQAPLTNIEWNFLPDNSKKQHNVYANGFPPLPFLFFLLRATKLYTHFIIFATFVHYPLQICVNAI